MDKTVKLAVAGSGKTTDVVNSLNTNERSLLITYTINNLNNIRVKIIKKFGNFPDNIYLYSYFDFLYSFCFKPYLWRELRVRGINWNVPPGWTLRINRNRPEYYIDNNGALYYNRISKLLEVKQVLSLINMRLEKYFDKLLIDEIQDLAGHDFNFLKSLSKSKVNMMFVGDFYQHTFDTSRDGGVNENLHENFSAYTEEFRQMGLNVDCNTLKKSYRCSPTICSFISKEMGIEMKSHRSDETVIQLIELDGDIKKLQKCERTVKLFYREHYKYNCYSRNWGDSKGEDRFNDVLVVLNKNTFDKFSKDNLVELKPQTRNKLYVACTRARGNLFFISEELYKRGLSDINRK